YMSPEQLEHGSKGVDARSDIYSVGVILYRCVSGRLPYRVRTLPDTTAVIKLERVAAALTDIQPEIDEDFSNLVERALAWDPNDRYQTADEFQRDLVRWLGSVNRIKSREEFHEVIPNEDPTDVMRESYSSSPEDNTRRYPRISQSTEKESGTQKTYP